MLMNISSSYVPDIHAITHLKPWADSDSANMQKLIVIVTFYTLSGLGQVSGLQQVGQVKQVEQVQQVKQVEQDKEC